MKATLCQIAGILLLAGITAASAAPQVPSSELPGRERERFKDSPLDRFTQPSPSAPLLLNEQGAGPDCQISKSRRSKPQTARKKRC